MHDFDLHWEVTNSRALRAVLDIEKFMAESCPLPRLSPLAQTVSLETRLVHGFVNRAMHGPFYAEGKATCDPRRLIWAHDLSIQTGQLTIAGWNSLAEHCLELGVAEFALDAIGFSHTTLGTEIPQEFVEALQNAPRVTLAARYIHEKGPGRRSLQDFLATPGLLKKMRFLLARIFPSPAHLIAKYGGSKKHPLPFLYFRRMMRAIRKLGT